MLSRRSLLAAAALPVLSRGSIAQTPFKISNKNVSAAQPIPYSSPFYHGPEDHQLFSASVVKYCTEVVDGNCMTFELTQKTPGQFDFTLFDKIVAFADENRLRMRGSHLIWGPTTPKWVNNITSPLELERAMNIYIRSVMTRHPRRLYNYIVVNEAIEENSITPRDMRPTVFQRVLGENHVALAFKMAANIDPTAELMINEYEIEFNTPKSKMKREGFKRLIYSLKDKGVKLDAIGLQSHLFPEFDIDHEGLARFVEDMAKLNLKIYITELDVSDQFVTGDAAERDVKNARYVYNYINTINSVKKISGLTTWCISDKQIWQNKWLKRADGTRLRGLPLDEFFQPKLMMNVMQHFAKGQPLSL